jgi:predicted anti-sigma-YlaC factor YlaD
MTFPTTPEALTCKQLIEFLSAYLDGELSVAERAVFDGHLAICEACRDYLTTYQEAIALAKSANQTDEAALPAPPEELIQAILKARP